MEHLKYGIVSDIDAAKGLARVKFEEDEIVSDWLPVWATAQGAAPSKTVLDISISTAAMRRSTVCFFIVRLL